MSGRGRFRSALAVLGLSALAHGLCVPTVAFAAETKTVLEGDVPLAPPDHFFLPFEVPAGTAEIQVIDTRDDRTNGIDFGVDDPSGYRGWAGGTVDPAIINERAASRAFVPGPVTVGTWRVVVGKAAIRQSPAKYKFEVTLRDTATLPPQTERKPYVIPAAPIAAERRWYAGDFHVHSAQSMDADALMDDMLPFAKSRGLDFIVVTDHNTITQLDYYAELQAKVPDVLLVAGNEITTYQGHGAAIGSTKWFEHKLGQPGVSMEAVVDQVHAANALFAINHPVLDIGNLCVGCAWKLEVPPQKVDAIELQNHGIDDGAAFFLPIAIRFWEDHLARGSHAAALGGSDDHSAGKYDKYGQLSSAVGSPTTMVLADGLSPGALLDGVRRGRTVVKLQGPADPMVELESEVPADERGIVHARSTRLRVRVTAGPQGGPPISGGGAGGGGAGPRTIRLVKNGNVEQTLDAPGEPFETTFDVRAPESGEDRYRVEAYVDDLIRTITSHVFVAKDEAGPDPVGEASLDAGGCRQSPRSSSRTAILALAIAVAVGWARARRRIVTPP